MKNQDRLESYNPSDYLHASSKAKNMEKWYLASPYAHREEKVEEQRAHDVSIITAKMIKTFPKAFIFSPIAYTHRLQEEYGATTLYGWYAFDLAMLDLCDRLIVVMMDGWQESTGVNLEIAHALNLDIPIHYIKVYESENSIAVDLDKLHDALLASKKECNEYTTSTLSS